MSSLIQALVMVVALVLTGATAPVVAQDPPEEAPPVEQPSAIVHMKDNRFRPARVTIPAGSTVLWLNDEDDASVEHNVIARDYRWASSNFITGESYAHTFSTPGTYRYFCDLHGGMTGQVIVE